FNFTRLIRNHQTKIFSATADDHPTSYLIDISVDEARLATAKANLASIDVVGLQERYAEFLDTLVARFGWQLKPTIRANAIEGDVSAAFRRRIEQDNAIDREFYEYARELTAQS